MPTDAAALQISTQPSSCTFTEQKSGLARPSRPHASTASIRRRGSGWIHRPVVTPISMRRHLGPDRRDGVADVHGFEGLQRVGPARVHVDGGDAEAGDGTGVAGEVTGLHRERRVRVLRTRAVQRRLQHRTPSFRSSRHPTRQD